MREKILKLLSLFTAPIEDVVKGRLEEIRADLAQTDEGITPKREQAVAAYGEQLRLLGQKREEKLCEVYSEFTEEELDRLIVSYEDPLRARETALHVKLLDVNSSWMNTAYQKTPALLDVMDDIARKWLENNTEGEVSESLKKAKEWTPPPPDLPPAA